MPPFVWLFEYFFMTVKVHMWSYDHGLPPPVWYGTSLVWRPCGIHTMCSGGPHHQVWLRNSSCLRVRVAWCRLQCRLKPILADSTIAQGGGVGPMYTPQKCNIMKQIVLGVLDYTQNFFAEKPIKKTIFGFAGYIYKNRWIYTYIYIYYIYIYVYLQINCICKQT